MLKASSQRVGVWLGFIALVLQLALMAGHHHAHAAEGLRCQASQSGVASTACDRDAGRTDPEPSDKDCPICVSLAAAPSAIAPPPAPLAIALLADTIFFKADDDRHIADKRTPRLVARGPPRSQLI